MANDAQEYIQQHEPARWHRSTVADGQWMQRNTFDVLNGNDEQLGMFIDALDGKLAASAAALSQAIADEAKIGYIPTVKVILSDTTGFDDKSKYPNVTKDFWPYSSNLAINMCSNNYNYPGGDKDAASTFVHEFAHCLDATFKEFKNPYGLDGSHYGN